MRPTARQKAVRRLERAGFTHAARAYEHAWAIGGVLCLAWGVAVSVLLVVRLWTVPVLFGVSAVAATGTSLLVLAAFLRRRRIWAAHGLWAIALATLLSLTVFTVARGRVLGLIGLIVFGVVATNLVLLGWHARRAAAEFQRVAGEDERGFDPIPVAKRAPTASEPPPPAQPATDVPAVPQPPSDSVRGK